jgi:hypothetical protein
MVFLKIKYLLCFGLINFFMLVDSEYLLERGINFCFLKTHSFFFIAFLPGDMFCYIRFGDEFV